MISLVELLGIGSNELVTIVGAGGKTTLLLGLGGELVGLDHGVVMTTTTKMGVDQLPDWAPRCRQVDGAVARGSAVFVIDSVIGEKVVGITPEYADELLAVADHVLVEADGARRRSLKAPAPHEPVVPTATSVFVVLAGIDAIGGRICDVAHRPELVAELVDRPLDARLTAADLATVLGDRSGGLRGAPDRARVVVGLTKVGTASERAAAKEVTDRLSGVSRIERVVRIGRESVAPGGSQ